MATARTRKRKSADPDAGGYEWFMSLTDAQKDAEVAQYDRPIPVGPDGLPGTPLTPELRRQVAKAKRRRQPGRPVVGKGAKRVMISVERSLLAEADRYAKARHMKRTELIAAGLRMVMGKAG